MTVRNFNNVTSVGTLTGPVASSATALGVQNFSNSPTVPFTITVDRNTATEEICLVTAVAGGTLTVTRGFDGSAAQAHSAGATVEHTAGAIEYAEANAHVNATANVHGVTGTLVGTDGAQSIFSKTLVSPVVQADATTGDAVVAWVPPDAPTRNLFRGMNTSGADVVTVDASGNATAHNVHATGTGQVDGVLTAAGGVTVPAGKTVVANGGITATTVNATGNVTVVGNETVTGTLSVTGGITGGSVTTLGPLALSQLAADSGGIAGLEMVYAKTDGGIYRRSGTGPLARIPVQFGGGTAFPASPQGGDMCVRTDLGTNGSSWQYFGVGVGSSGWVTDGPIYCTSTTRPTTTYTGMRIFETDTLRTCYWNGTAWVKSAGPVEVAYANGALGTSGQIGPGGNAIVSNGSFTMPIAADTVHIHSTLGFGVVQSTVGSVTVGVGAWNWAQTIDTGGNSGGITIPVVITSTVSLPAGSTAFFMSISDGAGGAVHMQYGALRVTF